MPRCRYRPVFSLVALLLSLAPAAQAQTPEPAGSGVTVPALIVERAGLDASTGWGFAPLSLTVLVGDTVTWTNHGTQAHTVTAAEAFDSGVINSGESWSHTFTTPGTVEYLCTLHPWMKGTVVVVAGATPTPTTGSAS